MDTNTFIVEIVKALSWPLITVLIIYIMRKTLSDLIPTNFKFGEIEMSFIAKQADNVASRIETELPKVKSSSNIQLQQDEYDAISARDVPAILDKGINSINRAARNLAKRAGVKNYQDLTEYAMVKKLSEDKVVDKNHCELYWELLVLSKSLKNAQKEGVNWTIAKRFLLNAKSFEQYFNNLNSETPVN